MNKMYESANSVEGIWTRGEIHVPKLFYILKRSAGRQGRRPYKSENGIVSMLNTGKVNKKLDNHE